MQFADLKMTIKGAGKPIAVRVTGRALHCLWGEGVGPQTAEGLVDEHMTMIEEIVADKLLASDVLDGVVVVNELDIDD